MVFAAACLETPSRRPRARGVVRAFIDGPESELVGDGDARVALAGELSDDLLDHRGETPQQEQGQAGSL